MSAESAIAASRTESMKKEKPSVLPVATAITFPTHINSLDAKILQYIYSIAKLQLFIESVKRMIVECSESAQEHQAAADSKAESNGEAKLGGIGDKQPNGEEQPDISTEADKDNTVKPSSEKANGVLEDGTPVPEKQPTQSDQLPLIPYIIALTGTLFSINENAFQSRLNLLSNYKLFRQSPIVISPIVTHVSYDSQDTSSPPMLDLPSAATGVKCLRALLSLCVICVNGYSKRLEQAKLDKAKYETDEGVPTNYYATLERIVKSEVFSELDIDLTLKDLTFPLPRDDVLLQNETFIEASLVDIDIKMIPLITNNLMLTINKLKISVLRFKNLKQTQNKKSIPNFEYSLHKIFILTLRLNDIYTVFRKFGRKIYLSNTEHLTDQKFLFQTRNPSYFRSHILAQMEDVFNSTKKNGPLIATLTRYIRQTAYFEVSIKNILDFTNFINQTCLLVEASLQKLDEFGLNWIVSEMRFRKVYSLPKKNLVDIYQFNNELKFKLLDIPLPGTNSRASQKEPIVEPSSFEKDLKNLELDSPTKDSRSRSSSVTSISSNSSATLGRKNSKRNSLILPSFTLNTGNQSSTSQNPPVPIPTPSPNRSRSNSLLFLNQNSSLTSLDAGLAKSSPTGNGTAAAGRRRSNSQPIKLDPELLAVTSYGLSAGLTRSPSGSIKRSPSQIKRNTSPSQSQQSSSLNSHVSLGSTPIPTLSKVQKQLLAVAEEDADSQPPKPRSQASFAAAAAITKKQQPLTANQRFQQHVRQSAKSGALMTQQKEVFTSIVFDPNTPSKYGLRKDPATVEVVESAPTTQPSVQTPPAKPAPRVYSERDRDTRRNTHRNTGTNNVDTESGESNNTFESTTTSSTVSSSNENGSVVKRVRFIGVPEYNPAEDKPPKYANKILNRFAMFSAPKLSKNVYKKRDELLVEEGLEFKHQVHAGDAPVLNQGSPSPVVRTLAASRQAAPQGYEPSHDPQSPSNRLSKIKNKLI